MAEKSSTGRRSAVKRCLDCDRRLEIRHFGVNRANKIDGRSDRCKACRNAYMRGVYSKRRDQNTAQFYARNPLRRKAQGAVRRALRSGTLKKPHRCERCGTLTERRFLDAHHSDGYEPANWLNVTWLCRTCHIGVHRAPNDDGQLELNGLMQT